MRIRIKVWTDSEGTRYLMPLAISRISLRGRISETWVLTAFAMHDGGSRIVEITVDEWDQLPYYWFHEDGEVAVVDRPQRTSDVLVREV